eukprot:Gb_19356 [translate_table: standard]
MEATLNFSYFHANNGWLCAGDHVGERILWTTTWQFSITIQNGFVTLSVDSDFRTCSIVFVEESAQSNDAVVLYLGMPVASGDWRDTPVQKMAFLFVLSSISVMLMEKLIEVTIRLPQMLVRDSAAELYLCEEIMFQLLVVFSVFEGQKLSSKPRHSTSTPMDYCLRF